MKEAFVFTKNVDRDNEFCRSSLKYTVHDPDITWKDLMDEFVHFLNGCSYSVPDGEWMSNNDIEKTIVDAHNDALDDLIKTFLNEGRENELLTHEDPNIRTRAKALREKKSSDSENLESW